MKRHPLPFIHAILALCLVLSSGQAAAGSRPSPAFPSQDFQRLAALPYAFTNEIVSTAIDPSGGYLYLGMSANPGRIERVRLSDFSAAGALELQSGETDVLKLLVDPAAGYLYAAVDGANRLVRIRLSDFTRQGQLDLQPGESGLRASAIDPAGGYLYLGTDSLPAKVIRVRLSDFTRQETLTLPEEDGSLLSAALDAAGGHLYFTGDTYPARLLRVRQSDFTRQEAILFPEGEDYLLGLGIDSAAGLAYLVSGNNPGIFIKVDLNPFQRLDGVPLEAGDNYIKDLLLDAAGGYAYLAAFTNPGRVVQVRLSDLAVSGRLTLEGGEGELSAVAGDLAAGLAYFADTLEAASVVKVALGNPPVIYGPDLSLQAEVTPAAGRAGQRLSYSMQVSSAGPGLATGVTLSDQLPAGATVRRMNPSQGACSQAGGQITCALGTLVPGASAQVEIEVIPAASFSHQASLSAALPDPNPLNNSLQATFNLGPAQPGLFLPLVTRSASLPPAPTEPHPAITLSAHSAGLTPADPLTLDWQATDAAGLGLELSVRVPGEVLSATGSLPGAVPANGERYYLTPQHTWQITPTLFLTPTASGSLQVMLPGSQEGEFAFSARLTGPGGYLPAGDSLSVLSSWSPAVFLHASPPAGANGELQVELLTAAGGAQPEPGLAPQAYVPPPVVVYASLTLNDGSQVALPTFAPALEALYRGPAQNARYDLFKGSLAFFGEGDYTFQASLLDDQPFGNPIYKGLAQFNIKRCDQPASLSGVFTSSSGDPLGGTIDYASVRLVDAVSGASVSAVTPEADGAYGLQARPGWYWLLGQAALGGAWHQASSPAPLLLECAGAQQADLVAAAPIPGAQAAEELTDRPAPAQATDFELSPNASDGLPRVNLYMVTTDAAGLGPVAGSLTDVFAESLFDAQLQNLHLITTDDLQQFIAFEQQRQLTGAQFNNNLANEALEAMGGAEFQITLKFVRLGSSGYQVQASLAKMNGEVVRRVASDFNSQSLTLAMVRQAAARLNRHDNDTKGIPDLFRRLRFEQERPIFPKLSVSVTPAVTLPGANVQASLALKDGNGELMPNKSVSLLHWPAGRALGEPPTVISGTTDAQGSFSAMLPVTTTLGVGHVDARFSRGERSWCVLGLQCQGAAVYTVQLPSSLSLTAGRQVLREGESTQVCANLSDQGAPAAGRTLLLAAAGGTLPQGGVTTTGPDGRRCFLFTAGAGVLAQVEASSSNPQATGKIAFQVLSALSQTIGASPTRVPQGGASAVDTQAKLGPAPIPGAPTQFSLAGPGSLSVINTHTNSNGRAATVYTAPSSGGAGTAMVQAVTFVGNLVITSTTQIAYQPPICQAPAGFNCYDVIPINGLGPYQVDDAGTVWGVTSDIQNNPQPASWSNGTTSVLGTILKPAFFNYMDVVDVAAGGYVALAGSPHPRGQDCGGLCTYAMRWAPGSGLTVMRASGSWERPLRINANGDMAGWQNYAYPHPAIWEVFTDTAKMLANVSMNNGFGRIAFSDGGTMSFNGGSNLLYTWSVGSQTPSSYGFSAYGMDLVGMTMVGVANGVAFKSSGGGLTSLGTLGGGASSASAVNANGAIVGWSSLPNGQTTAFLYKNGTMVDLASLVDYNQVNQITPAIDINANGWILLGAALLKPR